MAYPEPDPDPFLLNEPGIICVVTAKTGKTARGTHRAFLCRSLPYRVNPRHYSKDQRDKFLADTVLWEIIQLEPKTLDKSGWDVVRQFRVSVGHAADGRPFNVWPMLAGTIRNSFGSPSRVRLFADVYHENL